MPFALLCYGEVEDPREVELILHDMFHDDRVSAAREFFRSSFETIKTMIQEHTLHFFMSDEGHQFLFDELGKAGDTPMQPLRLVSGAEVGS
jgi:hypothetical protein